MIVTQKCQYGLRAVFEIAKRQAAGPVTIAHISEAQAIPRNFLGGILMRLRQEGVVDSSRGKQGGYHLAKPPTHTTVAEVVRAIDGPFRMSAHSDSGLPETSKDRPFNSVWRKAEHSLENVFNGISIKDIMDEEVSVLSTQNNNNFMI